MFSTAFKQQKLIWTCLELSGFKPSAVSVSKGISLAMSWQVCGHTFKLVQKY